MKIALFANNVFPDKVGGHERYVRGLAERLAADGHEVTLIAKRMDPTAPRTERSANGVQIVRHRTPSKRNPLFAPLYLVYAVSTVLRRAAGPRRDRDELLHPIFFVPAVPLALLRRTYVYTFHAPVWRELLSERQGTYFLPLWVQGAARRTVRSLERLVVRRAAVVVTMSEFMRDEVAQLDAEAGARVQLIAGGVDGEEFSPGEPSTGDVDGAVVFTARRLTPRTGVDVLIRAMNAVSREIPGVRCAIAGAGEMRGELEELVEELGLGASVELLGQITDAELVDWYRRADLVALPTVSLEGFGLTTAEALACGTPVLGTSAGATPELLADLDPALLVDAGDSEALAARLTELLAAPERLGAIAARGREHALPRWGWPEVANQYVELYGRINGARRR